MKNGKKVNWKEGLDRMCSYKHTHNSAVHIGFQGQEKDDEIKGSGNSINYKYRMHDPRIGRFFAVDPLAAKYPHNSTYAFSENRVIDGVEIEGLEVTHYTFAWNKKTREYEKVGSEYTIMGLAITSGFHFHYKGGPLVEKGYDQLNIFIPGKYSVLEKSIYMSKDPGTVVGEFGPYVSATNETYSGGEAESESGPVGGNVGAKFIINKTTLTVDNEGVDVKR